MKREIQMPPEGKWEKTRGGLTRDGDWTYKCSICGGDKHVLGRTVYYNNHHICKNCGAINLYPRDGDNVLIKERKKFLESYGLQ